MYLTLFNACAGKLYPLEYKIQNNEVYDPSCQAMMPG